MRLVLASFLLLAPTFATAQDPPAVPTIKLPPPQKTPAGKLGKLKVETTGKYVRWIAPHGLDIDPTDNGRVLYYSGLPGTYELIAYTAAGDVPSEPVRTTVTIGDGTPVPVDALRTKILDALRGAAGTSEEKAVWVKDLAALYRAAKKTCADKSLTTTDQLKAKLREAATALLDGDEPLKEVRQVVAGELAALFAGDQLTDANRDAAAALFVKLAAVLEAL
ncbi:unnamed protein product [Gemmata massiliana]|uniref:Uncharacterized protein n=1 Tax=Gemmata massiliana TaxID=1210884 RepID=A0A6P2DL92_9BACT|nr:hypothetical protein [Gemmata massiliana]VTS01518.1 unnamed protein product [Gemmata massiliana]